MIKKIIRAMGSGVTNPFHVILSDDQQYVMKFPGNPEGTIILFFESIFNDLAKYFDLPVVEKRHVKVDFDNTDLDITLLDGQVDTINGIGFAVLFQNKTTHVTSYELIEQAHNKIEFVKTIIFDFIINNTDRNKGNLLYDYSMKKLIIIDHTHSITGPLFKYVDRNDYLFKPFTLEDMHSNSLRLFDDFKTKQLLQKLLASEKVIILKDFINKVRNFNFENLMKIIKRVQNTWQINDDDVLFICNFLIERMRRVDEILSLLEINI